MLKLGCFVGMLLFSFSNLIAQTPFDFATEFSTKGAVSLPADLKRAFEIDAARLAIRASQIDDTQQLRIPKSQWQLYYRLLAYLYQQEELVQELVNCGFHTSTNPSVDYVELIYDRNVSWSKPLQEGVTSTDETIINQLMEQYSLIIQSNTNYDYKQDALVIRSARPLNMMLLTNQLKEIEGVSEIVFFRSETEESDILVDTMEEGWKVDYVWHFDTNKTHIWSYYVEQNGRIEFLAEKGDPLPDDWRCQ